MPGGSSKFTHYARWSYELLFSLYVAYFVVGREASREGSSKLIDWLAIPIVAVDRLIANWRHGYPWFPRGDAEYALDLAVIGFLTLILFICLRLIDQIRLSKSLVDYIALAVLVIGPLFTPIFRGRHLQENGYYAYTDVGHLHVFRGLQYGEVVLVLVSLGLYFSFGFLKRTAKTVALLFVAHFTFWSLIIIGLDWWELRDALFLYLILPFAASLLWALSMQNQGRRLSPTG